MHREAVRAFQNIIHGFDTEQQWQRALYAVREMDVLEKILLWISLSRSTLDLPATERVVVLSQYKVLYKNALKETDLKIDAGIPQSQREARDLVHLVKKYHDALSSLAAFVQLHIDIDESSDDSTAENSSVGPDVFGSSVSGQSGPLPPPS